MASLHVGPVVGKVTATTARVLAEADTRMELVATARAEDGHAVEEARVFERGRPAVVRLDGLRPATAYRLTLRGEDVQATGGFRTLPEHPTALNVGVVSCNYTPRRGPTDLWGDLRDRYVLPGELDLLLHVGDQVYGDRAFDTGLAILDGRARPSRAQAHAIQESYRTLYRQTWGLHPATRATLAHVPNLMIWDDHEITDDWGGRAAHRDPDTPEFAVGRLARLVYREYQRQLWDDVDVDAEPPSPLEHHFHVLGAIGLCFLDQRGGRSFGHDPARPYLGTAQWNEVQAALGAGGTFDQVRALLVVTSVPLVYLGDVISRIGGRLVDDLRDHWAWGPHRKEQIEMVRLLRRWKEARAGERELLVLGGDVHVGGHTVVRHAGRPIFRQLVASPITNKPPGPIAFSGLRLLLEMDDGLGSTYRFDHGDYTRRRNYGVVMVRVPAAGAPRLDGALVEAS